ncbi:DUF6944 family repetitive protein [Anoxybacillus gonensis]|uniref:DUF6944 family repetitive protein n=1 Tax=Anoxybacillus gonensis TaxID=198467 RepID=UPI0002BFDD4D|nr:hypothetical protein [Anoxybacillus gonensis]EMI09322.1 hypothetical protein F510_2632 [Anoxybacillus gonensis]
MNQPKALIGSFIQAVGTVTSAVGSIPSLSDKKQFALDLWGNVLQATGNALEADAETSDTLGVYGNEIQAIGNITVIAGLLNKEGNRLEITGNWLQSLGGLISFSDDWGDKHSSALNPIGNLLQAIGNALQAIGGIYEERGNKTEGQSLGIVGSWVQAIGSILCFLSQLERKAQSARLSAKSAQAPPRRLVAAAVWGGATRADGAWS